MIDDEIAYVGSQNCADPAFAPKPSFTPWVDVFFRALGPVVAQQQWLFLAAWRIERPGDQAVVGHPDPALAAPRPAPRGRHGRGDVRRRAHRAVR